MSTPPPYQRPSFEVVRHGARSEPIESDRNAPVAPEIRRTALRVRLVVGGLALVAIVATALLGGFDQVVAPPLAADESVPPAAVDEEFNAGPWLITVESAQLGVNLRDYRPPTDGDLVLQVNVRINVVDHRSRSILHAVELKDVSGLAPGTPTTRFLHDNTLALEAQPGLPTRVAFLWVLRQGAPAPKEITVVINGSVRRYQNFRYLGTTIEIDNPKAQVKVSVLDRTGAA